MSADISGLEALVADLARAGADLDRRARQVVSRGALNIKRGWAENARASSGRYAPHYPATIGYDLLSTPAGITAVIGPDKGGTQGPFGAILEYGSVHNPPHNDGGRALTAEEPRFIAAVEALGEGLL
ncbi:hypothetical protein [Kitasatospora sp. A2-31]|uniref:hypothetical protein n=1 Tax=Kitasatospora sp. A2-31 TaxID=2916414 RepID=UPI001EEF0E2D|nr:hypothetical protein [Kitasatospora sp. A2-31]MCG6499461.1 hypothetical protein [Kitasatospora sp. A2-31]